MMCNVFSVQLVIVRSGLRPYAWHMPTPSEAHVQYLLRVTRPNLVRSVGLLLEFCFSREMGACQEKCIFSAFGKNLLIGYRLINLFGRGFCSFVS